MTCKRCQSQAVVGTDTINQPTNKLIEDFLMHSRIQRLSLVTATLLLCFPCSLLFVPSSQVALAQTQTAQNRIAEAIRLTKEGQQLDNKGQFREALKKYQQALVIVREIGERSGEGVILNNIGGVYRKLGQYPKALEFYQQALAILKEVGDQAGVDATLSNIYRLLKAAEAIQLNNEGQQLYNKSQYQEALEKYQQALVIVREIGERQGEGAILSNIGLVYGELGQYPKALEFFQQALAIDKELSDRRGEGAILSNIGAVYRQLGQYAKALEFYQQALAIGKEVGDRSGVGITLNNIGLVYSYLGQYPKALEFYQQALAIRKQVGDRKHEGATLDNIGEVYLNLGQYPKALEFFQQALAIRQQVGDRSGEGTTLDKIGEVYRNLGQYPKALEFYQQALAIGKEVGDRPGVGTTLNNIGNAYFNLRQYAKALEFYQQALAIHKEVGNRLMEGTTLHNIGFLLQAQKQPELAIVFLKQSVSTYEEIREKLRVLPREEQESYTETVAGAYRRLADLLLQQDRVLEAQQVLDLLKVQELEDYLRNVRGTGQQLVILRPEEEILKKYNELQTTAIKLGQELAQLRKIPAASRTEAQQQRIAQLVKLEEDLNKAFNEFIERSDVVALVDQLSRTAQRQTVDLADLDALRDDLRQLEAVMVYPLILDDRLELVITTPDSPPLRRTVNVKRPDLNRVIAEFRQALQDPSKDAKIPAQQLYEWLIKPLEADLKQANAKTIIYAPDGQLRYIPLAAVYDGNSWLVQRYRVNNITAKSLTDFTTQPQPDLRVLAGAFVQGNHSVEVGESKFDFSGLPFAGREVETLATLLPKTTKLIDQAFSKDATTKQMNEYTVVHFATHAAFVPGDAKKSFILFGDGNTANLEEIGSWTLNNVDMVVLSACETGLGGNLGNGEEILGLGYQFQSRGARATVASLWSVDDGGTQALMDAFYAALQNPNSSKAESLRQAQVALITGNYEALGKQRGIEVQQRIRSGLPPKVSSRLSHPYYWAPFILIGNGL